jgi:hypothetical protein
MATDTIQGRVRTEYDEPAGTNSSLAQPNR